MDSEKALQQAIAVTEAGDRNLAQNILAKLVAANPQDQRGCLLLAGMVHRPGQAIDWLERVLAINPDNRAATRELNEHSVPSYQETG